MFAKNLPSIIFILSFIVPKQAIAQDEDKIFPCFSHRGEEFEFPDWYKGEKFKLSEGSIGRFKEYSLKRAYINLIPSSPDDYEGSAEKKTLNIEESACFLRKGKTVEIVDAFSWVSFLDRLKFWSEEERHFFYVKALDNLRNCLPATYLLEIKGCELREGKKIRINVSTANKTGKQQEGVLMEL